MLRLNCLSFILFVLFPVWFSFAATAVSTGQSTVVRRAQYCMNYLGVVAGSKVPTDAQGPIYPLPQLFNIVWCIKDTETYLILNPGTPLPSNTVVTILKGAERAVTEWIASRGDGMLQNGRFTWYGRAQSRIVFQVQNANNHQVMYGVLLTALTGMETYMWRLGYGCVDFKLYDGWNQVGQGSLAYG